MTGNPPKISCPCSIRQDTGCGRTDRPLPGNTTPLSSVSGCEKFRVCKISGDRRMCARMAQLGVLPGSEMELICPGRSKFMIRVKGSTVTLDELQAQHILVTPA